MEIDNHDGSIRVPEADDTKKAIEGAIKEYNQSAKLEDYPLLITVAYLDQMGVRWIAIKGFQTMRDAFKFGCQYSYRIWDQKEDSHG